MFSTCCEHRSLKENTFCPALVSVEGSETYRTLSEENMKLQAEIMQYKVIMS